MFLALFFPAKRQELSFTSGEKKEFRSEKNRRVAAQKPRTLATPSPSCHLLVRAARRKWVSVALSPATQDMPLVLLDPGSTGQVAGLCVVTTERGMCCALGPNSGPARDGPPTPFAAALHGRASAEPRHSLVGPYQEPLTQHRYSSHGEGMAGRGPDGEGEVQPPPAAD